MSTPVLLTLVVLSAVAGLAGTDLVLPAIPSLPDTLGGTPERAQFVLASFSAGTALGFVLFGEAGARLNTRPLLIVSLAGFAVLSLAAANAASLDELIALRFAQGLVSAGPAVFGPGIIRSLLDDGGALRALALLGSIESLVPALAPLVGYALLLGWGWQASFLLTACIAGVLVLGWTFTARSVPDRRARSNGHGYRHLLRSRIFLRYSLSQALTLGGLLTFVFGAPAVITGAMGGELGDFVTMQIIGILSYIAAANSSHRLVSRFGSNETIAFGTWMAAIGGTALVLYALIGSGAVWPIWPLFLIVNTGLGIRGPAGFYQAIVASGDDDSRGAALVMLFVLFTAAAGTASVAPLISLGLLPLAMACALICWASVAVFYGLGDSTGAGGAENGATK